MARGFGECFSGEGAIIRSAVPSAGKVSSCMSRAGRQRGAQGGLAGRRARQEEPAPPASLGCAAGEVTGALP